MASARSPSAPGSTNTGLTLPISAYTGIGSGRLAPASNSARPAVRLPVKATALVSGCRTNATAMSLRVLCSSEKTPAGIPVVSTARMTARAVSSDVAGCAGCALTTTGHPAASADAVSVPATENASGKLLALKTATGPIGIEHAPDVRPRRLQVGIGPIDAGVDPRPVARQVGEQPQLLDGAGALAGQPLGHRQRRLGVGHGEEFVAERLDLHGDLLEQVGPLVRRHRAVLVEGAVGRLERRVDVRGRGLVDATGATGGEGSGVRVHRGAGNQILAVNVMAALRRCPARRCSSSVPIGSMVMRTSSPACSVKSSGGTMPVPVRSRQPSGKALSRNRNSTSSAARSLHAAQLALRPSNAALAGTLDRDADLGGRSERLRRDIQRRARARSTARRPWPAAGRADSRPRCRASSCRCRWCSR